MPYSRRIKDLEFDYQVGKLSEEDYQLYDQRLRRQAVGLLQQIEQVAPMSADLDAEMEAEIAQRRRVQEQVAAPVSMKPVAPVLVTASAARANGRPGSCYGGGIGRSPVGQWQRECEQ